MLNETSSVSSRITGKREKSDPESIRRLELRAPRHLSNTPANDRSHHILEIAEGVKVEIAEFARDEPVECRFRAPMHLLAFCEQGVRKEGRSFVEGLPASFRKDVTRKFTFVPAGHRYIDCHEPRTLTRMIYFYFDPEILPVHSPLGLEGRSLTPQLLVEDIALSQTVIKIKKLIDSGTPEVGPYLHILAHVAIHEFVRMNTAVGRRVARGGLASWQQKRVSDYIDEHFAEQLPLDVLAELVGLSTYHFCRAFRHTFGKPPHRYQIGRRIAHAKKQLVKTSISVTEIGFSVGFSDTSSFTAAFRRATGTTPTVYRRSIT